MMRSVFLAAALLAVPAIAQQPPYPPGAYPQMQAPVLAIPALQADLAAEGRFRRGAVRP